MVCSVNKNDGEQVPAWMGRLARRQSETDEGVGRSVCTLTHQKKQ